MKFPRGYKIYIVIASIFALIGVILIVLLYRHVMGNLDGALKVASTVYFDRTPKTFRELPI